MAKMFTALAINAAVIAFLIVVARREYKPRARETARVSLNRVARLHRLCGGTHQNDDAHGCSKRSRFGASHSANSMTMCGRLAR